MKYRYKNMDLGEVARYIFGDGPAEGITCPYVENNRCAIYPVRPLICRLQGLFPEKLPCPHIKPEQILSKEQTNQLFEELIELERRTA